jgi:hypothetical protein
MIITIKSTMTSMPPTLIITWMAASKSASSKIKRPARATKLVISARPARYMLIVTSMPAAMSTAIVESARKMAHEITPVISFLLE